MNTILHPPLLPRWSLAWAVAVWRRWRRSTRPRTAPAVDLDALAELDARTLRDIGAPDALLARELARREDRPRRPHELFRDSGDWRHW